MSHKSVLAYVYDRPSPLPAPRALFPSYLDMATPDFAFYELRNNQGS